MSIRIVIITKGVYRQDALYNAQEWIDANVQKMGYSHGSRREYSTSPMKEPLTSQNVAAVKECREYVIEAQKRIVGKLDKAMKAMRDGKTPLQQIKNKFLAACDVNNAILYDSTMFNDMVIDMEHLDKIMAQEHIWLTEFSLE